MTKEERQQSLIKARHAAKWLGIYIVEQIETPRLRGELECLIAEFERLDEKEQTQIRAGRKSGYLGGKTKPAPGKKRGRPRKESK